MIKICTGCGHLSNEPIEKPAFACCPDNNYVPLTRGYALADIIGCALRLVDFDSETMLAHHRTSFHNRLRERAELYDKLLKGNKLPN